MTSRDPDIFQASYLDNRSSLYNVITERQKESAHGPSNGHMSGKVT